MWNDISVLVTFPLFTGLFPAWLPIVVGAAPRRWLSAAAQAGEGGAQSASLI